MAFEIKFSHRDPDKIPGLKSGGLSSIVVKTAFAGSILEMEDLHFHHDSAVLLPDYKNNAKGSDDSEGSDEDRATGLKVLAACFCWASQNKDQTMLIAGHTDTTGSADYNVGLSQLRADNVLFAILGNRDGWVDVCEKKHKVEDYQQILQWIANRFGWPCDPGGVNNKTGPGTQQAIKKFKERYNVEFTKSLPEDDRVDRDMWGAFFDVYMADLQTLLGVDADGLAALRKDLRWVDPKRMSVGCGENFPVEAQRKDNYRSKTNRRVEILFFKPGEEPLLKCHPSAGKCNAKECELYGLKLYQFQHIPWKVHLPTPVDASVELTEITGLYKPGHNDPADVTNKTTKSSGYLLGYKSDDNKGRIFINNIPRASTAVDWDALWKKDTQYIELTVDIKPGGVSLPNSAAVIWEWSDPDDPFNDDPSVRDDAGALLDPNDYSGGAKVGANPDDNFGVRDFPGANAGAGATYEAIGPHTLTLLAGTRQCETLIVSGKSKVRFHCTNVSGDNFKIKVQVKKHPLVVPKSGDETGVMTMWKRVDVEYRKMPDAFDLPVQQIPPSFENAFVQMNITDAQATPNREFMADLTKDFDSRSSAYVKKPPTGVFAHENKPGWFLLVAAMRAKKDVGTATASELYHGAAKIREMNYAGGVKGEVVVVPSKISSDVSHVIFIEASKTLLITIWKKDVDTPNAGETTLHLHSLDYQSEFKPGTGLLGNPGDGGAYDRTDDYYPRHKSEQPANTWIAGGLGFPEDVTIKVISPGSYDTGGVSPSNTKSGKGYFAGRTIIFTKHPSYTKFANSRVTIGGVWAAGDTATITIDGTDVTYTVAPGDDVDKIATALAAAIMKDATAKTKVQSKADGNIVKIAAALRGSAANGLTVTTKNSSKAGTMVSAGPLAGGGPDSDRLLSTCVHELGHAFGFPHKCGYFTFENPAKKSCAMNYTNTWLYSVGTKTVQRFFTGEEGLQLCALHLDGIRKVHLEDNPAMWNW